MTVSLWAELLLRSSIQGGVAVVVVWVLFRLFPRIPAHVQGWLWRLIALKFLLGLTIPVSFQTVRGNWGEGYEANFVEILMAILSGLSTLVALGILIRDLTIIRKLRGKSVEASYPDLILLATHMGIRRAPRIYTSWQIDRPMAAGFLRPVIYMPQGLDQDTGKVVLAHELAHIKRKDLVWQWLFTALDILFFFHPLARMVTREYQKCQETACDALAMDACHTGMAQYGRILLQFTVNSKVRELSLVANMAGTYASLYSRIIRLNRGGRPLATGSKLLLACFAISILPTWKTTHAAPLPISESEVQVLAQVAQPVAMTRSDSASATGRVMTLKEGRP